MPGSPREVRVVRAQPGDEAEVARFEEAFDNAVDPSQTRRFLADPRHHLLLGYLGGQPAGFVSAVEVFHPDKSPELFLNEIGVVESARRHGVARALIDHLKEVGREASCVNLWVLTDTDNVAARNLYASTGGHASVAPSVMFEYDLT
jgi:ribosomal protein S18 acetylase RimI-like enzyme